jgi:CysZ protein
VNLALLPFDIALPFVGEAAALLVNGWLLGREYFELAALRHLPQAAADALRCAANIAAVCSSPDY